MKKYITVIVIISFLFYSCNDFIEPNINKKTVILKSPLEMDTLSSTVSFWWEEVEQATEYNLQIVENSFDAPTQLILDSNVETTIFSIQLHEGLYQWRLKALNNSSETGYKTRSFYVKESEDLTDETLTLSSPQNNYNINNLKQRFKWNTLLNAEKYDIEIKDNFDDIFTYESTTEDTISINLLEGIYTWRVRAKNANSESSFSTDRTILIDITAPTKPIQVNPINNNVDTITTISFSWNTGSSLSEITDTLYLYSDSLVTEYETLYTNSTVIDYDFTSLGTYFWRLRSGDKAGNTSPFSDTRKFTIN